MELSRSTIDSPVVISSIGNIMVFGLSNRYDSAYPPRMSGKISHEEYAQTMRRINEVAERGLPNNFRWFLGGYLFCCCTLGLTLLPAFVIRSRIVKAIQKILDEENARVYHKLGIHWRFWQDPDSERGDFKIVVQFDYDQSIPSSLLLPE